MSDSLTDFDYPDPAHFFSNVLYQHYHDLGIDEAGRVCIQMTRNSSRLTTKVRPQITDSKSLDLADAQTFANVRGDTYVPEVSFQDLPRYTTSGQVIDPLQDANTTQSASDTQVLYVSCFKLNKFITTTQITNTGFFHVDQVDSQDFDDVRVDTHEDASSQDLQQCGQLLDPLHEADTTQSAHLIAGPDHFNTSLSMALPTDTHQGKGRIYDHSEPGTLQDTNSADPPKEPSTLPDSYQDRANEARRLENVSNDSNFSLLILMIVIKAVEIGYITNIYDNTLIPFKVSPEPDDSLLIRLIITSGRWYHCMYFTLLLLERSITFSNRMISRLSHWPTLEMFFIRAQFGP
jgi:hypothetical protein